MRHFTHTPMTKNTQRRGEVTSPVVKCFINSKFHYSEVSQQGYSHVFSECYQGYR